MKHKSPFSERRYEYESMHLYFLQERLFRRLEERKPAFLIGSRGTGKTTLLRSLYWRERISNPYLRTELDEKPFADKCIGIYLKLPEIQLAGISSWLRECPAYQRNQIFSVYLEFICLQEILTAVAALAVENVIQISTSDEAVCAAKIAEIVPGVVASAEAVMGKPRSLLEFSRAIRVSRQRIENACLSGLSPGDLAAELQLHGQFYSIIKAVVDELSTVLGNLGSSKPWNFKICFDEGEALDELGRLVINSWMRLSRDPLYPIIAFVSRPSDISSTLIDNLTLTDADRELIDLDDMTDREFEDLAEGVSTVRIKVATHGSGPNEGTTPRFKAEALFGKLNLNRLLEITLSESVNEKARALLERARRHTRETTAKANAPKPTRLGDDEAPYIYQTYLYEKLDLAKPSAEKPAWAKRKAESQDTRKKMVAAYMSICHEFGMELRYASADMIFQVSDRCIRDFLGCLDSIFRKANVSAEEFVSRSEPWAWGIQNTALKNASRTKYQSIPRSGVNVPTPTGRLVEGLAMLTSKIQTSSSDGIQHLQAPERGKFVLEMTRVPMEERIAILSLIREAAEAGFLRLLDWREGAWRIRVHTSLAAAYGFSYRGAYYDYPLSLQSIKTLIQADSAEETKEVVEEISLLNDRRPTASLFSDE